jgi:hypothetical protein
MTWRRRAQDDFASEIRSHLELERAGLIDEGLSPDEARAAARRRFDGRSDIVGRELWIERIVRASGGAGSFYDPPWQAFVVPILIVAVIGVLATWIRSRRALTINPASLLRTT